MPFEMHNVRVETLANKAPHRATIPLHSIAAGELDR